MSFSYDVKEELCSCITDMDKKYACLYGMLLFCKQFDSSQITFQTEHEKVAGLFCSLVDDMLNGRKIVSVTKTEKKNKGTIFSLNIENEADRFSLISRYKIPSKEKMHRIQQDNIDINGLDAFFAGAFLACGSIIDPNKEYHLEFVTPYFNLSNEMQQLLMTLGISTKRLERKGVQVLYIKGSENIEDLLTFMGATMCSLEIMNIKILKDVRNKANRIANCDSANIEKTVEASSRQVEDINFIEKNRGLDFLSDELRDIAEIRLEYPELSLRELGQMLDKPIGRSGANHRMKKISAIADEIREKKDIME